MKWWKFDALLQDDGWIEPAFIQTDDQGKIQEICAEPPRENIDEVVRGWALPGFQNAHSHAFQYAMAGLAENLPAHSNDDDFWSWRDSMYQVALNVSPDHVEAIASWLYSEMARVGYTAVAEFHYLHHDPEGNPYENTALMGEKLMQAAQNAGIGLTLIPIFYQKGDFGQPPKPEQRRFISKSVEDYFRLIEKSQQLARNYPNVRIGVGVHSLRAAETQDIQKIAENTKETPLHLHVSEQQKEVDRSLEYLKARPVAWCLDNLAVDERFSFVHATHLDEEEVKKLAGSKVNVVLCPSTEGNLGDGFFPLRTYWELGGRWTIGTDSHIGLSPLEELRWLDYGQRLKRQMRNTLCTKGGEDSGTLAFKESIVTGRRALGEPSHQFFSKGQTLDAVVINSQVPLLGQRPKERRLSTLIYASDTTALLGTLTNGKWIVKNGRHMYTAKP